MIKKKKKKQHHGVKNTCAQHQRLRKPLSVETVWCYVFQCKVKLPCQAKAIYQQDSETLLIWDGLRQSGKGCCGLISPHFGQHGCCVPQADEEKDHRDCHQCIVQKPASVMLWGSLSAHARL